MLCICRTYVSAGIFWQMLRCDTVFDLSRAVVVGVVGSGGAWLFLGDLGEVFKGGGPPEADGLLVTILGEGCCRPRGGCYDAGGDAVFTCFVPAGGGDATPEMVLALDRNLERVSIH